jgi:glycosyltransferase involved in cell wall biosynthesis
MRQLLPPSSFPKKPYWIQRASRTTLLRAFRQTRNHFLAISEDTQAYLKTVLPSAMHSRIALLKNAIPLHRFSHPQRAEWIPGSPLRLINVGSFVPKKNQKLAVLVLQELLNLGLDAQLILAGDGPLKAEVQEQVRTLGLSEKVFFLGNITDIELQYKEADLYLHTAWEEPFGLVLIEAMASGLSVVALDAGGNRELISDGRTGRLLPLNSTPAQVGTAIQDWMGSQKQQQEARQQAMAFAAGFGIESYVDQLLLHYNRIQPA